MKSGIHPEYVDTTVTCTCGSTFTTRSTATSGAISVEVCSACHPFYTGKQKILDTGGRVARFQARYGKKAANKCSSRGADTPQSGGAGAVVVWSSDRVPRGGQPPMSQPGGQLDAVESLRAEHADLERQLADPSVHANPGRARSLGRRYAELSAIVAAADAWTTAAGDLAAAKELAELDDSFAAELPALTTTVEAAHDRMFRLLVPRDPDDGRDVILEVKAGEGGEESALFAADLVRMYTRYAERRGWSTEVLSSTDSDLGGYKDIALAVKSKGTDPEGVWSRLKYEGGVHRVQRVPVTESQGRIHTSAAGVLVMPEPEDTGEVEIDANDLRIDVYRSSGPGGQSVNTTDSAVRITHLPTGVVVSCQNEKSQLQNKEQAMRILRARLHQLAVEAAAAEAADARRSQVRTVDRSERIRTYNFPENRISDHRTGFKAYNLDTVLDGELDPVVQSAIDQDEAARLAAAGTGSAA